MTLQGRLEFACGRFCKISLSREVGSIAYGVLPIDDLAPAIECSRINNIYIDMSTLSYCRHSPPSRMRAPYPSTESHGVAAHSSTVLSYLHGGLVHRESTRHGFNKGMAVQSHCLHPPARHGR